MNPNQTPFSPLDQGLIDDLCAVVECNTKLIQWLSGLAQAVNNNDLHRAKHLAALAQRTVLAGEPRLH
jgi:hypothetical protein